jgi:hypothetical protein
MAVAPASAMSSGLYDRGGNAGIMAENYRSASALLGISSTGVATVTGAIYGMSGTTTKTTVHLYLQRYVNGAWEDVDDWVSSGETANRTLTKEKQVAKGYKYRTKASCYAYSGTKSEHVTKYSATVTY